MMGTRIVPSGPEFILLHQQPQASTFFRNRTNGLLKTPTHALHGAGNYLVYILFPPPTLFVQLSRPVIRL